MKRTSSPATLKGLLQHLRFTVVLAFAAGWFVSGTALAQVDQCDATISANTEEDILYYLNEPVGIVVELGAGVVINTEPDGPPDNYLDIPQFTYDLDCTAAGLPGCVDAGNTVVFDTGSITTNCTDENDLPITFETSQTGNQITFTPAAPSTVIRNFSEQTCTVTFDVTVTGVSGDNLEKEIIELAGFASTGENAGMCDNGLTAGDSATVRFNLSTVISTFRVVKDFSDDNEMPVDVHLRCNTGLPLEQSFSITDPATDGQWPVVAFTVRAYEAGALDCRVYEEPIPAGYDHSYAASSVDGVADLVDQDADGCIYEGVVNGAYLCEISNTARPGEFTVTKDWILSGAEGDEVVEEAWVDITCDDRILTLDGVELEGDETNSVSVYLEGDGASATITVDTSDGTANCWASENVTQSGIESDDSDCASRPIAAAGSSSCTIVNTAFFEGIPTLNAFGLAVMSLLMLTVGLIGYRRFAV